jgi:hypothetical protein
MFFPALSPEVVTNTFTPQSETQMWVNMFYAHPYVYTLLYCLIDMVFYGLVATVALGASTFAKNGFFVLASPMLLYVILHFVFAAFGLEQFSPMFFLRPNQMFINANILIIIAEAAVILCLTLLSFNMLEVKKDVC